MDPRSDLLGKLMPHDVLEHLQKLLLTSSADQDELRSAVRISNFYLAEIGPDTAAADNAALYYVHSPFPAGSDAVFFGPDTYLFISFLQAATCYISTPPRSVVDVCCGAGAGVIHVARTFPQARGIGLDLNPKALELARINAALANASVDFRTSNLYAALPNELKPEGIDLIVTNPPYIASATSGDALPIYADGGAAHGLDLSISIVERGLKLLSARGVLIIYTGVAIPKARPGHDMWLERLKGFPGTELVEYRILHPDMWSEDIGRGAYADVGRIQAVGAVLKRSRSGSELLKG
jgi:methylase of polypeptide subunit release factors